MTCASSETSAIFMYSLQLASVITSQVIMHCSGQVNGVHACATHEQVFELASMVDFGQSDTTRTLTQVID